MTYCVRSHPHQLEAVDTPLQRPRRSHEVGLAMKLMAKALPLVAWRLKADPKDARCLGPRRCEDPRDASSARRMDPGSLFFSYASPFLGAVLGLCACGSDSSTGELSILLESEELIAEGLVAGPETENILDGWSVDFEQYLVNVGNIELRLAADPTVRYQAVERWVVDLTRLPASGLELWHITQLETSSYEFHYQTPVAGEESELANGVSESDRARLVEQGWSYAITGTMSSPAGQSCPPEALAAPGDASPVGANASGDPCYSATSIRFELGAAAPALFGPCEIDGTPGLAVTSQGNQTAAASIHGDHLFFNGFPEGSEGGVMRLAQWLADSDLDLNGVVTNQELGAIRPSQLAEIDDRFALGGAPINPLETMLDYVAAQLLTQGHFQGEGECPVRLPTAR